MQCKHGCLLNKCNVLDWLYWFHTVSKPEGFLTVLIQYVLLSEGSYVCGICGKKYKYYNCFQTHVRAHRGETHWNTYTLTLAHTYTTTVTHSIHQRHVHLLQGRTGTGVHIQHKQCCRCWTQVKVGQWKKTRWLPGGVDLRDVGPLWSKVTTWYCNFRRNCRALSFKRDVVIWDQRLLSWSYCGQASNPSHNNTGKILFLSCHLQERQRETQHSMCLSNPIKKRDFLNIHKSPLYITWSC